MSEDRKHHSYSPSTLQSLEACPAYQGRNTQHLRAIAGTLAHKVVETGQDDNRLDDDDAGAAADCLDFLSRRRQLMIEAANRAGGMITELNEAYLPVDDCLFEDAAATTAGYVDNVLVAFDLKYAEAFDWKYGKWPVETAENNLQAIAYCLGLFKKFPTLEKIKFFFKMPALELITEATFNRADVPALYLRVQAVIHHAREARRLGDFSTARPGVPVCNFCANIGRCPKVTEFACRVGSKFSPLEIPPSITPTQVQDPTSVGLGMKLAAVLETWAGAFKRVATDRVMRGAPIPAGYRWESRQGDREITDMKGFEQFALRFLTQDEYQSALKVSIGAVEKLIGDKAPRGSKKAQIDEFKQSLEDGGVIARGDSFAFLKVANNKN